jgi:FtsP/CotA-like multicopper oxidase with cupredoxin domain
MEVIETDFVPIEPYTTDSLAIAIGQRYSIIVETDQPVDNYWIRTTPVQGCSSNHTPVDVRTGILRYEGAPSNLPTTTMQPNINFTCEDEPLASLKPIVRWEVGSSPSNNVTDSTYEVGLQQSRGFARWTIGENPLL